MNLGSRIKEERTKRGITQKQLSKELNISRQSISKWEAGVTYPDIERLIQISNLFDISLDSLIKNDKGLKKEIIIDGHSSSEFWNFMNKKGWIMIIAIAFIAWMIIASIFD